MTILNDHDDNSDNDGNHDGDDNSNQDNDEVQEEQINENIFRETRLCIY